MLIVVKGSATFQGGVSRNSSRTCNILLISVVHVSKNWRNNNLYKVVMRKYFAIYVLGIILDMGSANERRLYIAMSPLIGWVHTQNGSPIQFVNLVIRNKYSS